MRASRTSEARHHSTMHESRAICPIDRCFALHTLALRRAQCGYNRAAPTMQITPANAVGNFQSAHTLQLV
jgi:hypothetical protein